MADRVEKLFADYQERLDKKKRKKEKAKDNVSGKGEDPSEPSSPSSSSSESSSTDSSNPKKQFEKAKSDLPYLKLDIKFELPTYNGELNAEKLDDWIKQIEVYCRIQNLVDDQIKIQLATFRLKGTALIWWESKTQEDLLTKGKIISSWYEFTSVLKKQFYPLGYIQQAMMDWKNLKQGKSHNVQEYTQEFRKRDLILGIPIYYCRIKHSIV